MWAWNPDDAHEGNASGLIKAFTKRLQEAPDEEAQQVVREMIRINCLAVFWARMFMVGAKRPDALGTILWPYATSEAVLRSADARKDAIDLIAATYDLVELAERDAFERRVLQLDFPQAENAAHYRHRFLLEIFAPIGLAHLATAEARELVHTIPEEQRARPNRRPFEITVTTGTPDRFWWLKRQGVDLNSSANLTILDRAEALTNAVGAGGKNIKNLDLAAGLSAVKRLAAQLGPLRIITHLDRAALASYCAAYALWAEATQAIQTYGAMVKSPSGYPVQSPYVSIANRQTEIMMRIASEFGFTPASRSRISAPVEAERSLFDGPFPSERKEVYRSE